MNRRRLRLVWAALACAAGLGVGLGAGRPALAAEGRLVDAATGSPVAEGIVVAGGREVRATAAGAFHVDGAPDRVLARAPGYRAASATAAELAAAGGAIRLQPFTPRALYLTVYGVGSSSLRNSALALIRAGAANALVIDLKGDRGIVPYRSAVPLTASPGARPITTVKDLPALVKTLHAQGVYLIARIVTFKDDPLASAHPELAIKRTSGGLFRDNEGLAWTDPFQPAVWDYNISLAEEAARAGFDEVQFDYVRFPDSSAMLSLAKPSTQANRVAAISGFLAEARRRLAPYNVFIAVDIFGYVCWNTDDTGIGQRLEAMAASADYLSPMLYPSGFRFGIPGVRNPVANSYAIVSQSLAEARRRLGVSPKRFRPWLQAFRDYGFDRRLFDADEVADQIRAAQAAGADGWMLWNPRNTYEGAGLTAAPQPGPAAAAGR
jgi:hypothetical protein